MKVRGFFARIFRARLAASVMGGGKVRFRPACGAIGDVATTWRRLLPTDAGACSSFQDTKANDKQQEQHDHHFVLVLLFGCPSDLHCAVMVPFIEIALDRTRSTRWVDKEKPRREVSQNEHQSTPTHVLKNEKQSQKKNSSKTTVCCRPSLKSDADLRKLFVGFLLAYERYWNRVRDGHSRLRSCVCSCLGGAYSLDSQIYFMWP